MPATPLAHCMRFKIATKGINIVIIRVLQIFEIKET